MVNYKCDKPKCKYQEEFYVGPNFKDEIPEICPKCGKGKLVEQFPDTFHGGLDVIGGFEYQYGKKAWRKGKSAHDQAGYLVKGEDGKYADPY